MCPTRALIIDLNDQTEAELLTGMPVTTATEAEAAARAISARLGGTDGRHVIITRGGDGALWLDCEADAMEHILGTEDKPFDTVGAGDCFMVIQPSHTCARQNV